MIITLTTMVNVLYLLDAWSVLIKRNCMYNRKARAREDRAFILDADIGAMAPSVRLVFPQLSGIIATLLYRTYC